MFICKSEKDGKFIMTQFFHGLREEKNWFDLSGYGLQRIYGFLAERYLSYWLKNTQSFQLFQSGLLILVF